MKKSILIFLISILAIYFSTSESVITDYKNSVLSDDYYPKWVSSLFDENDEKYFIKKYDLNNTDRLFYAQGETGSLQFAREIATERARLLCSNAMNKELSKELGKNINTVLEITGLEEEANFWTISEDDQTGAKSATYYVVYSISKSMWDKNKNRLKNMF